MIEAFSTDAALAEAAAAATVEALWSGIDARGRASLIATGGRSPHLIYDRLTRTSIDWSRVTVSLSDDRFVPPDDPASNEKLVRERLLVGRVAAARFQPLRYEAATPEASADLAEPHLAALAPYDMLLLGMGEDGHIASLIPGSPMLARGLDPASGRFVLGVPAGVGSPPLARVTLTLPALASARATLVLIAGDRKREIVDRERGLPVHALLEQAKGPVRVLWTP
ncbi:MAG TPA: 6-phosphogluconolactonase [Phenylobacterium sp.]|nr:6-phosphogluconolactonase [Phenylobacterium sp.]